MDTNTAYKFGQLGSVASPGTLVPPIGKVFIAFQAIGGSGATVAVSELVAEDGRWPQGGGSPAHAYAHAAGDAQEDAHSDNGNNDDGVVTLSSGVKNLQRGMIVESDTMCPSNEANPYVIKSVESTTSFTLAKKNSPNRVATVAAEIASGSAEAMTFFIEGSQGVGGQDAAVSYPDGTMMYGRWTKIVAAAPNIVIAYIGD
tara:strand:- start:2008 stop:2610 length:603 start_codon:yes stop_codon:yes gene_type:complete